MRDTPSPVDRSAAADGCGCGPPPGAAPRTDLRAFRVHGMDCADEVAALKRALGPLVGDESALSFDLMAGRIYVSSPGPGVSDRKILAAVAAAGMRAVAVGDEAPASDSWWERHGRLTATLVSATAIFAGLLLDASSRGGLMVALGLRESAVALTWPARAAYLAAALGGLWFVAPRAWVALRSLRADMNLLMTAAILGAVGIGELLEAATVSFLFALSLMLESWSVGRARRAVRALLDLTPPRARVLDPADGSERLVAPHEVALGQSVVARAGERVALDGVVVAGEAHVDASPVTGESLPAVAGPGTRVFAGTIAVDGALTIRVDRVASDTVLARIVRRVAEAGRRRARSERWVEAFARIYTPTVFAAAGLTALLPPLVGAGSWGDWLYRALVLLVIGCPCALVISTPVSIVAGLACAARHGVLVKGGDFLELPATLSQVAIDKTGTLTTGILEVVDVVGLGGRGPESVLADAAAIELRSNHPVGAAIAAAAASAGLAVAPAADARVLPGRGCRATVRGRGAWVGSLRLLREVGAATGEVEARAATMCEGGRTVVAVGAEDEARGLIALSDRPRPTAGRAVATLRRLGVESIVMLTGDSRASALAIAREVGIDQVHADLLPDDKVALLDSLRTERTGTRPRHPVLAFVGDGINDAPALAAADLGIAMGARGADAAIETADVALMSDDLGRLPWLIRHSRRVGATIRANVAFALAVKAAFVVATLAGTASLWAAIAADMGASLAVVANGLRLLRSPD